jgi:hypothetical protein
MNKQTQRPGLRRAFGFRRETLEGLPELFGSHLFGFAFLAHEFEFAFGGFDLCVDFLLDAGRCFFQFG